MSFCRRRGKSPARTLLDSSYHHASMEGLAGRQRRGRPDILHFTLLEVLGSPLNKAGKLDIFIHTQTGSLIEVNPSVRLPRNYDRFKGLFEKLLLEGIIKSDSGEVLLRLIEDGITVLRRRFGSGNFFLLSEKGARLSRAALAEYARPRQPLVFIIGCFPHGDFSEEVRSIADMELRLSEYTLEAWVAASRILCLLESIVLGETVSV